MRIGPVTDQQIGGLHHGLRHIGVQIQCADHRDVGSDNFPNQGEHLTVRVMGMRGNRSSVLADVDPI